MVTTAEISRSKRAELRAQQEANQENQGKENEKKKELFVSPDDI